MFRGTVTDVRPNACSYLSQKEGETEEIFLIRLSELGHSVSVQTATGQTQVGPTLCLSIVMTSAVQEKAGTRLKP